MAQRFGPVRRTAAVAAALGIAAAMPAVMGAPAAAAPGAPAKAAAPAAAPPSGQVAAQPANARWASQIFERHAGAQSGADVTALAASLDRGTQPATAIRAALLKRSAVEPTVGQKFEDLLERSADPSGLAYWSTRISDGRLSYENLLVALTISNEAWTKAGATPEGYTHWVYEHVLGRDSDPSGQAYWEARLASGTSRDRFVRSFLRSGERGRAVVRHSYRGNLLRNADAGGLNSWVKKYTTSQVGELDIDVALLASSESRNAGCGYDSKYCLFPFPNSRQTVQDASTETGRRVSFKPEWLPANNKGKHVNPVEWNRNDGFSPGQAIVLRVPGIDLEQSGLAGIENIGASLDEDAPVIIWDNTSHERVPYWAELDSHAAAGAADQVLYIRPAVNYGAGHEITVGIAGLKDAAGKVLPAPAKFDRERDWIAENAPSGEFPDDVDLLGFGDPQYIVQTTFDLSTLANQGMAPDQLYLAWHFTVASTENTTGRMLHIRDDALSTVGTGAPAFTVSKVTPNPRAGVLKRVEGTFTVPKYLTGAGQPGDGFKNGANGVPVRNGTYTANYDCEIPSSAVEAPARPTVYGHGLFGDLGEVRSGSQAAMVTGHNMVYCATDTIGMAEADVANAATILQDLSTFGTMPDRTQQGLLNTVFLGRLMSNDAGFVSNAAFKSGGDPLIDTSALFYDGNSQGSVVGGAYVAIDPKVEAGVLGVAGMNYSTLLERSVDFDPFFDLMKATYPNRVDQAVGLGLIQMLWDRGETNGYAAYLNAEDNLPGTPDKRILIHTALGDHQVATVTAEVEARTAGVPIHRPTYLAGRTTDVEPGWGLATLVYPSTGSALVLWDSGANLAPLTNLPPRTGEDPHGDPRSSAQAQQQKSEFLRTGGTVTDVCSAAACTAPAT